MRAMVLSKPGQTLQMTELPAPSPGPGQVLLQVHVCGICRTDLHIVDGELTEPKLPLIPGHQIVGTVVQTGSKNSLFPPGTKVGVPWLGRCCGRCDYCQSGQENLCDNSKYTGYQIDGGFAEMCLAEEEFCFHIPDGYPDLQAAPLLCAGLIGYRSLRIAGKGKRLGFYGFGASAHILIQVARYQQREVFAFTRPGDMKSQNFARQLGAVWVGNSDEMPSEPLDAVIIFAPAGELVPQALKAVRKGGTVVCAGIHMSDIPSFPYSILWGERVVRSVANLTRQDASEFLALAPEIPVQTEVHPYCLEDTNRALDDLRKGRFTGAAAIVINQ